MFLEKSTWNFVLNSKGIFVWGFLSGGLCQGCLCPDTTISIVLKNSGDKLKGILGSVQVGLK